MANSIFISFMGGTITPPVNIPGNLTVDKIGLDSTNQDAWIQRNGAGIIQLGNAATSTAFARLQLGGATSSFGAIKAIGTTIQARLADDSAYTEFDVGSLVAVTNVRLGATGVLAVSATAPTIGSGFGTSPSIVASNGTAAFTVNVGTGGTASNGVITMPAATTGWIAHVENLTGTLGNYANQRTVQIASTTTSITLENQTISTGAALAWTASDVLVVTAIAY